MQKISIRIFDISTYSKVIIKIAQPQKSEWDFLKITHSTDLRPVHCYIIQFLPNTISR